MDGYKIYTFAKHINDAADNTFFWENELIKAVLRSEVIGEMQALGYEYSEANPDIMINYRIFKDDFEFEGWVDNYADDKYWGQFSLSARTREADDKRTYNLKKGTLLIQFVDVDKSKLVWQGYASGVLDDAKILDDDKIRLDTAVEKIFEEYNFKATGY